MWHSFWTDKKRRRTTLDVAIPLSMGIVITLTAFAIFISLLYRIVPERPSLLTWFMIALFLVTVLLVVAIFACRSTNTGKR